ncbi:4-hydroxy-3-methylbut-2-enyl diphosphate reductase [Streptomyces sp. 4N509B]|uniref:4-hydroxy-3-methylbut-2-enyl diphosphate reductase n=1 Tax=Streptomyces sp. 4N509B TaxID=3457413 RepID=UPI003FD6B65A
MLAEPRSFCAGVERAIEIVEVALERFGPPVYVRKQIVHNHRVVAELETRGARFVDTVDEVPTGAVCVFSAHGVSPAVREAAASRELTVIDATCPLVSKVHQESRRFAEDERTILLIGHRDHEEVEGTFGEAPEHTLVVGTVEEVRELELPRDARVAYLTQTTLALDETREIVEAIHERFDDPRGPGSEDICYASQNRQNAVRAVAARTELVLVVGSVNSSNSVRMVEVAQGEGVPAYLVPEARDLREEWLTGVASVGVSAGASAPGELVNELLMRLAELGFAHVEVEQTATEDVVFGLPSALKNPKAATA